jgi:hypothetical protein
MLRLVVARTLTTTPSKQIIRATFLRRDESLHTCPMPVMDSKADFFRVNGLNHRDRTRIGVRREQPSFEPRDAGRYVLLGIGSYHGILTDDALHVLAQPGTRGVDVMVGDLSAALEANLRDCPSNVPAAAAFRVAALSAFSMASLERYQRRVTIFSRVARAVSQEMLLDGHGSRVAVLMPLKEAVASMTLHLENLTTSLSSLSEDEGRLRQIAGADGHPLGLGELAQAIDSVHHEAADLQAHTANISQHINSSFQLLQTSMDTQRNNMMRFNIGLSIGAVTTSVGALVAGVFGMNNLPQILMDHRVGSVAMGAALLGPVVGFLAGLRSLHLMQRHPARTDVVLLREVFRKVDLCVRGINSKSEEGPLTEEGVSTIIAEATGLKPDKESRKFLMRLFDTDGDGLVRSGEIKRKGRNDLEAFQN